MISLMKKVAIFITVLCMVLSMIKTSVKEINVERSLDVEYEIITLRDITVTDNNEESLGMIPEYQIATVHQEKDNKLLVQWKELHGWITMDEKEAYKIVPRRGVSKNYDKRKESSYNERELLKIINLEEVDIDKLEGNFLLIDNESMALVTYKNYRAIASGRVITEQLDENEIPEGIYKVTEKALGGTVYGPNHNVWIRYWVAFGKEYGLQESKHCKTHSTANYYHSYANVLNSIAKEMYENTEIGSLVVVT